MVRLREVRESYLIVLDTFLRERPTWAVIVTVVRHGDRFKAVQSFLFKLIAANLEQVLDFDDGVLNLVLALNLLDKAVVIGVIPYLYVILCLVAIRAEVREASCEYVHPACVLVIVRIKNIPVKERESFPTELSTVHISDNRCVASSFDRLTELVPGYFHVLVSPTGNKLVVYLCFLV